jgi:hypothetical protein
VLRDHRVRYRIYDIDSMLSTRMAGALRAIQAAQGTLGR